MHEQFACNVWHHRKNAFTIVNSVLAGAQPFLLGMSTWFKPKSVSIMLAILVTTEWNQKCNNEIDWLEHAQVTVVMSLSFPHHH